MFGNVGSGSSISDLLQSLGNAFDTVANNPGGTPSSAVQALTNVTNSLQSTSTSIQALREKADQQMAPTCGRSTPPQKSRAQSQIVAIRRGRGRHVDLRTS